MGILPESMSGTVTTTTIRRAEPTPKKTFIFDFEKKEFVVDTMNHIVTTTDNETIIRGVVEKLFNDTRYRHLIYDNSRGNEIPDLIAQDEPYEVFECELKRLIQESLIYHPYIKNVTNIDIRQDGPSIYASFMVEAIDGIIFAVEREVKS